MKRSYNPPLSLFFHLVVTLIISAAIIFITLFAFFHFRENNDRHPFEKHIEMYTRLLSESIGHPPNKNKAIEISNKLSIQIGFEGINNSWKTSDSVPLARELDQQKGGKKDDLFFKILETEEGVFVFIDDTKFSKHKKQKAFIILILFLTIILTVAWLELRRHLLPVKELEKAFAEVAQGNFNITLNFARPREFKQTAIGFNVMVDRIKEMIVSREILIRDVSHELKTPLARIKLALQFLPLSRDRESIEEDIRELEGLINKILKMDSPEKLELSRKNIISILEKFVSAIKKNYPSITVKTNFTKENIQTLCNEEQLLVVFNNIIQNSIKYGKPPFKINVSVDTNENLLRNIIWKDFHQSINNNLNEIFIKIEFIDHGKGIKPENLEMIFEPFFQENSARTPGNNSHGLGLYIIRNIISKHHGFIVASNGHDLENNAITNSQCVFTILLPLI